MGKRSILAALAVLRDLCRNLRRDLVALQKHTVHAQPEPRRLADLAHRVQRNLVGGVLPLELPFEIDETRLLGLEHRDAREKALLALAGRALLTLSSIRLGQDHLLELGHVPK
jgi:hypothetical protein